MKIISQKINGVVNPIGYGFDKIIASWKVVESISSKQEKGILEVALDEDFNNIIYVANDNIVDSLGTVIDIKQEPRTRYYWRVKIVGDAKDSCVSETQYFETGKIDEKWSGKWIAAEENAKYHPTFTKSLDIKEDVKSARLYISCAGVFEAYLDGKKIGNEILTPYINDYDTGLQIITFDVTEEIKNAKELEILVGNGWYRSNYGLDGGYNFGDTLATIAELHLSYENGAEEVIGTDNSWNVYASDVVESGIYYGEDLDRTVGGRVGSAVAEKTKAREIEAPKALLDRYSIPVIVKEVLKAKEIIKTPAGETVIDFGQNHAGVMEFEADFPVGTVITIDCGEVLQQGNFYNDNYRSARSRFVYTSDGTRELVHPRFTFFGYRYIRVSGWVGELTLDSIHSNVIYSDMERTGYISTSNDKINRLFENCIWGQKSNFLDHPTDCPQRDERLAWTGDAQVFSQTASYNMDTRAFYRKFLRDLRYDALRNNGAVSSYIPSKGGLAGSASIWGDVGTFTPEVVYNTFGCLSDVEEHYEMMKNWVEYMHKNDEEHGGKGYFLNGFQFGDWLGLDGATEQSFKGGTNDDYLGTVYYFRSTEITANMAKRLGRTEDYEKYTKLAAKIKKAIFDEYFSPTGRLCCDTQAAYVVALAFDIYIDKDKLINQFLERLGKDNFQIKCGFVGAPLLCLTLSKCGQTELAYHFLFNEGFPSWLYCVNLGATTIWERWNSLLEDGSISGTGMNSLNHYSYGTIVQFMYEYIGGIKPAEPGFRRATIAPQPAMKFRYFNSSIDTATGKYASNWEIKEDGTFVLNVEVPFGGEANVSLPRFSKENLKVEGLDPANITAEGQILLTNGQYTISYKPSKDYRFVYDMNTKLCDLASDDEALEILKEDCPPAYGSIMSGDKEFGAADFNQLQYMFFMGLNPEIVGKTVSRLSKLNRW